MSDLQKEEENNTAISESKQRQLAGLKPFPKGVSGNPAGRPKGSLSVIGSIKQIFESDPEQFQEFINKYLKDPRNRQHIVEMIDGKPQGSTTNIAVGVNVSNYQLTEEDKENWAIKYLEGAGYEVRKK